MKKNPQSLCLKELIVTTPEIILTVGGGAYIMIAIGLLKLLLGEIKDLRNTIMEFKDNHERRLSIVETQIKGLQKHG